MQNELNPPQFAAATHEGGPLLIFAGAGSGKTRTLTFRIAHLLKLGYRPYRILAVTFTNKAAREMRERLLALVGEEVTRDLWIGTFHSIAVRLLRRYHDAVSLGKNFVIYDDADQRAVIARIVRDLGLDDADYPPKNLLGWINREKRDGRSAERATLKGVAAEVYLHYEQALRKANAVDFDDLLIYAARLSEAEGPAGEDLRNRFEHVLVDEFQDTNLVQYRMIRALSARSQNLCVVGDDDQSIYRWRGADVRLIRSFRDDFPNAKVVKLEQNYRSSSNIVNAALAVISPAEDREPKNLWTQAEAGEKVRIRELYNERSEADFVAQTIQNEARRGTPLDQIAVFYRVHAQSRVLEESLRALGIGYQIIGGLKFFDRAEIKDVIAYLRLLVNAQSDVDVLRIINVPARGIGSKTVEHLTTLATQKGLSISEALSQIGEASAAERKLKTFFELLERLREHTSTLAPHQAASYVLETTGYRKALRDEDSVESEARLQNLDEFLGSIEDYEHKAHQNGEEPTLSGFLESVSLVAAVDSLEAGPRVSLMTVHSAKGLEFRSVLLSGMEEDIFPFRSEDRDDQEEERRLAYVAITRARERLYITHTQSRTLFGRQRFLSPSRYLSDLPKEVVEYQNLASARKSSLPVSRPTLAPRLAPGTRIVERDPEYNQAQPRAFAGALVRHQQFGRGVIERVDYPGQKILQVRFEKDNQMRKIDARFLDFDN